MKIRIGSPWRNPALHRERRGRLVPAGAPTGREGAAVQTGCIAARRRRGLPPRTLGPRRILLTAAAVACLAAADAAGQERRIASPAGRSATQADGTYDARAGNVGGRWIEIRYGRPIRRGRDIFGPEDYREFLNDGADVWRAGANQSTRLITETTLVFGTAEVPPGEYTVFIDLQADPWEFIVSRWPAQLTYDFDNRDALWGAYEYTPDRDVVRAPMTVELLDHSFDQLSWQFLDVTADGGALALVWERTLASVRFTFEPDREPSP